jgi:excisionase family DNA binding protein
LDRHREHLLGGTAAPPAPETADDLAEALSVAEAAKRAGVSRSFLYERIASGELPTVKWGKRRLVLVPTLRRCLASRETGAA